MDMPRDNDSFEIYLDNFLNIEVGLLKYIFMSTN